MQFEIDRSHGGQLPWCLVGEVRRSRAPDPMRPPAPSFVARLAPPEVDAGAVAQAAASVEATARCRA